MRYKVGDTVYRKADVYKRRAPYLEGIVTRVYSDKSELTGSYYPELYEVLWTKCGQKRMEKVEKGFLPHGLSPCKGVIR